MDLKVTFTNYNYPNLIMNDNKVIEQEGMATQWSDLLSRFFETHRKRSSDVLVLRAFIF